MTKRLVLADVPAGFSIAGQEQVFKSTGLFPQSRTVATSEVTNGAEGEVLAIVSGVPAFVSGSASVVDGDRGDITVTGSGLVWTIDPDAVTYAKIQNVSATDRVLGRSSAGAGDIQEIVCTAAGRALIDDVDAAAQRTTLGAAAASHAHTLADITDEGALAALNTVGTAQIDNNAVTYAKIQDVTAGDRVLGRISGAGDPEEIVCTAAGRAILDDADAAAQRTTLGAAAASHSHTAGDLPDLDGITPPNASVNISQQQLLSMRIENRTSDPASPAVGEIWFRTDL